MDDPPERILPEARLLALAKTGDLEAFEQIVALHERRVFALALRLTGSVEDAKDATQERETTSKATSRRTSPSANGRSLS
jgi:RNA polymerase sigma-70 factor (ECF subfamily)